MNKSLHHILVLDDDPDIRMMIKIILEYHNYSVVVAERAEKAEELLRTDAFDLLIMDMLLSGASGTDICSEFKKDATLGHIPIIMISAHPNAREICLSSGADDFVSKPFDMEEILSKIRQFVLPN